MKSFSVLKHTIPITLPGLSNLIVCVCAYLVPPHESTMDQDDNSNSDVDELSDEEEQELSDLGDSDDEQVTQ